MKDTLYNLMRDATRLTRSGSLVEATRVIQRALRASRAGPSVAEAPAAPLKPGGFNDQPSSKDGTVNEADSALVIDGCVFEVVAPEVAVPDEVAVPQPGSAHVPESEPEIVGTGQFISGSHTEGSLARTYKLYIPPGSAGRMLPLVVMLHGCTQNPDDFAAGTGMNERAREQGFYVLYPAQAQEANPSRCWNWFKHNHQRREGGEAALIAGMSRAVTLQYGIDPQRVYIAGLSAGGAMAAIVGGLFPETFAAVGVHSGLSAGAATDLVGALKAMKSGNAGSAATFRSAVPTIVFHGDQDRTVHPSNGDHVIAAVRGNLANSAPNTASGANTRQVEQTVAAGGRRVTRTSYRDSRDTVVAEHWLVHGAAHAWAGGSPAGSYTDASGPDATGEMLRFFFTHAGKKPT